MWTRMKRSERSRRLALAGLSALATCLSVCAIGTEAAPARNRVTLESDSSLAGAVQRALAESDLDLVWQVGTPFPEIDAAWQAANRSQELRTYFASDGPYLTARRHSLEGWTLRLALAGLERGGAREAVGPAALAVEGNQARYVRGTMVEWYVNRAEGLEQGFSLRARPLATATATAEDEGEDEPLELHFDVAGSLRLADAAAARVRFVDEDGEAVLSMGQLYAFDAVGRELACHFAARGGDLALVLDDAGAVYPVTIDPLIVSESGRLDTALPPPQDRFGTSIDVEGSVAIVGAPMPSGVAYVFRRGADQWTLESKLTPGGHAGTKFGQDVTIRGDLAVVGAPAEDGTVARSGAIHTFAFDGERWIPEGRRLPTSPKPDGEFGTAVDMTFDSLFVGAPREDGAQTAGGAVYMYRRSPGNWSVMKRWTNPGGASTSLLGASLDAHNQRLVIGAPSAFGSGGALHLYKQQLVSGVWNFDRTLTSGHTRDLGFSVAIDTDAIVAGAPTSRVGGEERGMAVVYRRVVGDSWALLKVLGGAGFRERFGSSVALDKSAGPLRAVVGSPSDSTSVNDAGSARVYGISLSASSVTLEQTLTAPEQHPSAGFGRSVAAAGPEVFVGADLEVIGPDRSGTVRVYRKTSGTWLETDTWMGRARDPLDEFGLAVDIAGDLAVVGSPGDDDLGTDSGVAYVFEHQGGSWQHTARLRMVASKQGGERFGETVATDGTRIIVGAPSAHFSGINFAGAAIVFECELDEWVGLSVRPEVPVRDANFGSAVAIEGEVALIGAPAEKVFGTGSAAYVARRQANGTWKQQQRLEGELNSAFGFDVALAQGLALIGAPTANASEGEVLVYREESGSWQLDETLSADPAQGVQLGSSLDASGPSLVVAAPSGGVRSVHVFSRSQAGYVLVDTLTRSAAEFGFHAAIDGDLVAVGARERAFAFRRAGPVWIESELVPSDGFSAGIVARVAASGSTVLAGDPVASTVVEDAGAALLFEVPPADALQAFGFGDGSSGPCPCDNESAVGSGQGCRNSTGKGGLLRGLNSASVAQDDLILRAEKLPAGKLALLMVSEGYSELGLPFYDGLRFQAGKTTRIAARTTKANGAAAWGHLSSHGLWGPGDERTFQVYYRDKKGPCGKKANLTNALWIRFAP